MHSLFQHRPGALLPALILTIGLSAATGCHESDPIHGQAQSLPGDEAEPRAAETGSRQGGAPESPPTEAPKLLLGGIVRAAELPAGFTTEVRETPADRAAGADSPRVLVTVRSAEKKSQGRRVGVLIGRDDRAVTERAFKIAAYRAYIDGSTQALKNLGYRITHQEIPDVDSIDLEKRIRARLTFERDDQRMKVEHLIFLVDHSIHISVSADHEDDFQLISRWADSIRPE
jgi:hypothetical protein